MGLAIAEVVPSAVGLAANWATMMAVVLLLFGVILSAQDLGALAG